ncbi:GNAT family N-acetyltransferase [Shimia sp.]|uniref:GNAT family N-acetyltransferase n=1 Tax=Shimia sp. TaxID=1954381 RepID=UPI00356615AE
MTPMPGRYRVRIADSREDLLAAQRLRHRAFRGATDAGLDSDGYDALCRHFLVEEGGGGGPVCCFRILPLRDGGDIGRSYSAQFYDLGALGGFAGPMAEVGRFCIDPDRHDPDILRAAWGSLTAYVDENAVEMLFGCSSFRGTDASLYADALALLRERHLAPRCWRPGIRAAEVVRFAAGPRRAPDPKRAQRHMPPLLRSYLMMGGWVSDHAVVDRQLDTLHVFTGLEVGAIPAARKRLLRALAA